MEKNNLWVEKYRPTSLDELVLDPLHKDIIHKFLKEGNIPNLLLSGGVGTGKTTISKILINTLDCDSIILNASSDRGIDIVRNRILMFASMSSFKKWKIVFMDEADLLTPESFYALRNIMETYSKNTRFILTANYINKIIEPIRSRCQIMEFKALPKEFIKKKLSHILAKEKVEYNDADLDTLIESYYPDIRSMINNLQMNTIENRWKVQEVGFRDNEKVLQYLKAGDIASIRKMDLDYVEVYKYLFDKAEAISSDKATALYISLIVAEFLYKEVSIADKEINFVACLYTIAEKANIRIIKR
jgi:replication factor C small subunit